jgi:NAD(P)-dependent dehydrogenase (short-subunit alcohol dehydrogenase family)
MRDQERPLEGRVALVAGATRGAGRGIACMLGAAGATVYCSGRSVRGAPSPLGRPETIEDTAELVDARGGRGIAVRTDHTREAEVERLVARIREEEGRLDLLVNDVWGGDSMIDWSGRVWTLDLAAARLLIDQAVFSHLVTARHAGALMAEQGSGLIVEVTDAAGDGYRGHLLYDLVKAAVRRLGYAMAWEFMAVGVTALSVTPGFLRSEAVLDHFGVTEDNWRDAVEKDPFFAESETPFFIGRGIAALAADPQVRALAGAVLSADELAARYGFTDVDGRRPAFHPYFDKVADELAAKGAGLTGEERFLLLARYMDVHRDPSRAVQARRLAAGLGFSALGAGLAPAGGL